MKKNETVWQTALDRGVSRRDFMKMCTVIAATIGLDFTQSNKVQAAMETKERVPVIWLQFQDCTGCSESFIRSSHPKTESVLLDMISLEYSEVLSAAAGHQAEKAKESVYEKYKGKYVLAVEGSVANPEYLSVAGQGVIKEFEKAAENAFAIIAYGSCSSWGGIAAAKPNPTNAKPVTSLDTKGTPVIRVPGCPPIAEVMTGVIAHILTFGTVPELDSLGRPKAFFRHRIHDKCNRRAYFDAGLFVENFDDEGAKQGYCLYKVGCKGPTTYSSCAEMRWNEGTSYPIQSGNPCIGCTEKDFWDNGPFYTRVSKIPGTQTTINPDQIGLYAAGATVVGIGAHAAITAVKKDKDVPNEGRGEK
ncbi:hydrogenase small subunit [Bacillaceae bacterium S4-13-56]